MKDEYLIYGDTVRKIAGEARRLINSKAEMDAEEIYAALCKVSPGGGTPLPSSDGVAFSSTQITPDEDYRVNYNFIAQVVYHVQRMIGSKQDMTKEQILEGLSEVIFIPQARIQNIVEMLLCETGTSAWIPTYESGSMYTEAVMLPCETSTTYAAITMILSSIFLDAWDHAERYVTSDSNRIQPRTTWTYNSVEQPIDSGRMLVIEVRTGDLIDAEEVVVGG